MSGVNSAPDPRGTHAEKYFTDESVDRIVAGAQADLHGGTVYTGVRVDVNRARASKTALLNAIAFLASAP